MSARRPPLLTRRDELRGLVPRLVAAGVVALDTEFLWERTYYPVLGLVQAAVPGGDCWLIDAVEIGDLAPLAPALASPDVVKVLHDAQQDLAILARATGAMPRNVFDTRQSAGFCGFSPVLSLQALVREVLGVELSKTETRSDWIRRPLTPEQLMYGAEDVLHLPALRERLVSLCKDDVVRAWQREENLRYDDPLLYGDVPAREAVRKVRGRRGDAPREEARLAELAAWREEEARARDLPRRRVLDDECLVALAHHAPATVVDFYSVPGVGRRVPARVAAAAVAAIRRGDAVPDCDLPRRVRADPAEKRLLKKKADAFLAALPGRCAPYGIDPSLVAARHDAEALARGEPGRLGRGWRARLLGTPGGDPAGA